MKAKPVKLKIGTGYVDCTKEEATHVTIKLAGPTGLLTLPVITKGSRKDSISWTWNGDTESPTLKPSVLTRAHNFTCHSFVNDGKAQFLSDCSHEFAGQTVELLEVNSVIEDK